MSTVRVLVWVDHQRARLIELTNRETRAVRLGSDAPTGTPVPTVSRVATPDVQSELFESIAETVAGAVGIVILGPSNDRQALLRYLKAHHPSIAKHVIAVEQMGHVTYTMLRTYARTYFRLADRSRSN